MRICIVGAGAMGSLFGGRLAAAGFEVVLLDTWAEHVAAMAAAGLRLDTPSGPLNVPVRATTEAAGITGIDAAIVQVNAHATAEVAAGIAPMLAPGGVALTLQNGIGNVEALAAALGADRVLALSLIHI